MKKAIVIGSLIILTILIIILIKSNQILRIEGIKVKLEANTLVVEDCSYENIAACVKKINMGEDIANLKFAYKNFRKNGYPASLTVTLNDKLILSQDNLEIEKNKTNDYQFFLNFHVLNDEVILFTYSWGNKLNTTLYAVDINGNILLEEKNLDDNMVIKDYTHFIDYFKNNVIVYATSLKNDYYYQDKNVCDIDKDTVVEAYYTYIYLDKEFIKKRTQDITAQDFILNNDIECS